MLQICYSKEAGRNQSICGTNLPCLTRHTATHSWQTLPYQQSETPANSGNMHLSTLRMLRPADETHLSHKQRTNRVLLAHCHEGNANMILFAQLSKKHRIHPPISGREVIHVQLCSGSKAEGTRTMNTRFSSPRPLRLTLLTSLIS
jgi:hypothetical protein